MSDKDDDKPRLEPNKSPVSVRRAKKLRYLSEYLSKQESRKNCKKVSKILKKSEHERTEDERATLASHEDIVKRISKNKEKRQLNHLRTLETEDNDELLQSKCAELAKIIQRSKKTVIYTGAGISTAASIPDYRGPQGVWTLLQKGEQLEPQDLSDAEPTLTHMCIKQLHEHGHVKHVVSQNCDGLHMRSGLPRQVLSEVHGDMFIEICHSCRPHREYIRLFDVTENTGVRRHFTGRYCQKCGGKLKDTIVHFGEKGGMKSPYRWKEAVRAANKCDLILCLGSSLKILKKYACLWCMDRAKLKRPNLVIVNLQWTPKDESATLKINGKCDAVMEKVMQMLGYSIPTYSKLEDPIFHLASALENDELVSTSKKVLQAPDCLPRLRSHGISRTPTPSDFSDSQLSTASSSDSSDVQNDLIEGRDVFTNNASMSHGVSVCDNKHRIASSTKPKILSNSRDLCLSKSERICNEAKIAMQERLVNAKLNEMYATCQDLQTANCSKGKKYHMNGILHHTAGQHDGTVGLSPKPQYDPLRGGPFDPGPSNHEDKLVYLQMLQSQLDELKKKQKLLKNQEEHTIIKHSQTGSSKNVTLTGSSLNNQVIHISDNVSKRQGNLQSLLTTDTVQMLQAKLGINSHSSEQCIPCQKSPTSHGASPSVNKNSLQTSPIKMEHKPCHFLKTEQEIDSAANCRKTKICSLESELKRNLNEQKSLEARLVSMCANQHQVEDQAQQHHKFEQLQLHQQFLLQEQLRQHTKNVNNKQEEILKLFVFQQQSLTSQHSGQLLLLRQKYLGEIQKIETRIKKLKKSQSELVKQLNTLRDNLKIEVSTQSIVKQVSPNKLLSLPACGDKMVDSKEIKSGLQAGPIPPKAELSPSRKDHSIAALLHGGSPNSSKELLLNGSVIPGITTIKTEQTSTCISCQFLRDYGMSKKRCIKCEELKVKPTISHGQIHASANNRVDATFPTNVPKLTYSLADSGNFIKEQTDISLLNHDYALDSCSRNRNLSVCKSSVSSQSGNVIYLISPKSSKGKNHTCTSATASDARNILINDKGIPRRKVHVTIPTSSECATVSQGNLKLSPLAIYATFTAENKFCASNPLSSPKSVSVKEKIEDSDNTNKEKVSFSLPDENCEGKRLNYLNMCDKVQTVKESAVCPIRSNSHSEISDSTVDSDTKILGTRPSRCHSQSDVGNTIKEEMEAVYINDAVTVQSGVEVADASEEPGKPGRKRKLTRCLSVPGWFGKGLNVKKRRRY